MDLVDQRYQAPNTEGEIVLGAYFDEYSSDADEPRVQRNAEPVSVEKPRVDYATKVPDTSSIIALISQRRVDRVPLGEASREDACLPCGQDTAIQPNIVLHELPCGHRWCKNCLARAFKFALHHDTFHRLKCCTKDEIPLKYFKRIAEDRSPLQPTYEPGWEPGTHIDDYVMAQGSQGGQESHGSALKDKKVSRNPPRVSHYVERDQETFISRKDLALYRLKLEEVETLPKSTIYCYRRVCGSFIPMSCRTQTKGICPRCQRVTCKRCRKGWHTHESNSGKCDARSDRMEVVRNDRKLMVFARRRGWKRCPNCRMYVEKVRGGCLSVLCRCGRHFFYG